MARYKDPVLKRCRSLGIDPTYLGYNKKSKKNSNTGRKKVSEYGLQLKEKQKTKFVYGVLEKQFRKYFERFLRRDFHEFLRQIIACNTFRHLMP